MTRMAMFSAKAYDQRSFDAANVDRGVDIDYHESRLDASTAGYAAGAQVVCVFVNDDLSAGVLEALAGHGVGIVAMRCAGYNNVDLGAAARLGITVVRVPAYSPNAVAEHTLALMLSPQPQDPPRAQPGSGPQLLPRRARRFRHGRQDRSGDRDRQHRSDRRPAAVASAL